MSNHDACPRMSIPRFADSPADVLRRAISRAAEHHGVTVAEIKGLSERGYRCMINTGADASQSVKHFHVHIMGGGHMPRPNDQDWGPAATNADKLAAQHALLAAAKAYAEESATLDGNRN